MSPMPSEFKAYVLVLIELNASNNWPNWGGRVLHEVHLGSSSWKIATFQYKCSFGSSCSKITFAVKLRTPHLSKDLANRTGLRTKHALKAYANAYAGPIEDCRKTTKETQTTPVYSASSIEP